jgi:DNA-binding NarL/FixJ family response regulator
MLLVEPETLLRRTVALTARSIGVGTIHEAANAATAQRMLNERAYQGAVIAVEYGPNQASDLALLDQLRNGKTASDPAIPIAVLAERVDTTLLQALRERRVTKIIVKPFRARVLLDAFSEFAGTSLA